MKECRCISDLYVDVQDDRADVDAHKRFRDHVSGCGQCREDFRWYGLTVRALHTLDTVSPPADFMQQLSSRLDRIDSPAYLTYFRNLFSSAPSIPLPVGVVSMALIVFLGFALYNHSVPGGLPWFGYEQASQGPDVRPPRLPGTGMLAKGTDTSAAFPTSPLTQSAVSPRYSTKAHNAVPVDSETLSQVFPTVADRIGADNLTVESRSVDTAVESLKKLLPDLQGRLVEVKPRDRGTVVLGVMIPSKAYADLTSRLINYGAVEAGAGSEVSPPKPTEEDSKNVFLYIRFLPPR